MSDTPISGESQVFPVHDPDGTNDFRLPAIETLTRAEIAQVTSARQIGGHEDDMPKAESGQGEPATADGPQTPTERQSPKVPPSIGPELAFVKVPGAPGVPPNVREIWHYTDAAGAIGILQSQSLWATSLSSLNDSGEYAYGRSVLDSITARAYASRHLRPRQKDHIRRITDAADALWEEDSIFIVSASLARDSLPQWRGYGGATPHAIRLDSRGDFAILGATDRRYRGGDPLLSWGCVVYSPSEQEQLLKAALGFAAAFTPEVEAQSNGHTVLTHAQLLASCLAHCKSPSFETEHEVRLLAIAPPDAVRQYRATSYGIAPSLVITGSRDLMRMVSTVERLPIVGGAVGPFAARATSATGMGWLMNTIGYSEPDVEVSASTYR